MEVLQKLNCSPTEEQGRKKERRKDLQVICGAASGLKSKAHKKVEEKYYKIKSYLCCHVWHTAPHTYTHTPSFV